MHVSSLELGAEACTHILSSEPKHAYTYQAQSRSMHTHIELGAEACMHISSSQHISDKKSNKDLRNKDCLSVSFSNTLYVLHVSVDMQHV
jgi:hypothetical protein